ncbi:sensor histidine kinase [Micromonospora cathayae]|uniref:histidine kinase n=1 Tax=Micromonospora cathayae TaxID=3028804 RepID=A0ABY7ZIC0_9ACTN|nr:histidine kinase [Micromonospora sp. HUAS 3]WDZ82729.1 histidine kinase [Micromonospora sp. HUAS 3]
MRRLATQGLRLIRADDPETGWLVRIVLTVLLVCSLLFYPGMSGFVRPALVASFTGWLFFVGADTRFPRAARIALAVAALLPAAVTPLPHNGSVLLFLYSSLFTFVLLPRMPLWAILSLTGAVIAVLLTGLWLAGHGATAMLTQPAMIVILVLFSLHRREHRLRTEETLRTQEALAQAAALDERTRIARELHDVLAHSLGALGVQLEVAEAQLTERGDVAGAAERVRRARRLAADGLVEARSAVEALRADVPPLPRALDDLAAGHRVDHATPVTLRTVGGPRGLPSGAEVSLLGTAREALTNAARHAPGTPVTLTLEYAGSSVRLTVENRVPAATAAGGGFGLTGVRERIALVGGTLEAGVVDGGWRVTAEVPG